MIPEALKAIDLKISAKVRFLSATSLASSGPNWVLPRNQALKVESGIPVRAAIFVLEIPAA